MSDCIPTTRKAEGIYKSIGIHRQGLQQGCTLLKNSEAKHPKIQEIIFQIC